VYETTTAAGAPATSSGTVYVPTTPATTGKRLVVAWAHPTIGMAAQCTPSHAADPAAAIPGLAEMLAKGWVVTSTDYTGLGTPGVLPYLVGEGESRNVIDSVRAAENLKGTDAGETYAVWGHSQGGHAALFTPSVSKTYAPGLHLVGVAGAAPAAEFSSLFSLQWDQSISWVIGSEVAQSWPHFYPSLQLSQVLTPLARASSKQLASICITADASALAASFGPYFTKPFFSVDPSSVPAWRAAFVKNTPLAPRGVPVFVAQGLADTVVLPSTTAQLEQSWCSKGVRIDVRWYPSATHFTIPTIAAPAAVSWLAGRFAGTSAPSTCGSTPPVTPATNPSTTS
jgi:predicted esterase